MVYTNPHGLSELVHIEGGRHTERAPLTRINVGAGMEGNMGELSVELLFRQPVGLWAHRCLTFRSLGFSVT